MACIPFRFVVLALVVGATLIDYLTRVNINVAMVAMAHHEETTVLRDVCPIPDMKLNGNITEPNVRVHPNSVTYDWDQEKQGAILGSFFYSYVLMQVPSGRLAEIVGGKWIVAVSLLGSGLINIATPFLAFSVPLLTTSRVFLGIMQGGIFPACYAILPKWLPQKERTIGFGLIEVGANIGSVLAAILTGYLCEHGFANGWPSAFFVAGLLAVLHFVFWCLLVKSTPDHHKFVSQEELKKIKDKTREELENSTVEEKPSVPWISILTSGPVLSAMFARFTVVWTYQLLQSKLPCYLNNILHVSPTKNGLLNSLLYITVSLSLCSGGILSEKIIERQWFSRTNTRKLFVVISRLGVCICLVLVPTAQCSATMVMALLITAMVFYGLISGADVPIPAELSGNFPATLFALINMCGASSGFAAPHLVGIILETPGYDIFFLWSMVFYGSAALAAIGAIVFIIFGSADKQKWDELHDEAKPLRAYAANIAHNSTKNA